jgi:hypothetical protein
MYIFKLFLTKVKAYFVAMQLMVKETARHLKVPNSALHHYTPKKETLPLQGAR